MSDSIETILRFHNTNSFGSREDLVSQSQDVTATYRKLAKEEIRKLVIEALKDDENCEEYLTCLSCLHPGCLIEFHHQFLEAKIYYPGLIFFNATVEVACRLAVLIESVDESLTRSHLLSCLAWTGGVSAQKMFAKWRRTNPKWANDLHIPLQTYTTEAGWELDANAQRRDLFLPKVVPLVTPNAPAAIQSAITIGNRSDKTCPWCKRDLVSLFDIDATNKSVAYMNLPPMRWRFLTCDVCTTFGPIYAKTVEDQSSWHTSNQRPEYLPVEDEEFDSLPEGPLVLSNREQHFMESASWTGVPNARFSQIGGLPTWVQNAEYLDCPDCSQKMVFVGQLSMEDFDPMMVGILYAFICSDCGNTGTNYQC